MKRLIFALCLALSFGAFANDPTTGDGISTTALNPEALAKIGPTMKSAPGSGFLDNNKIAVGTILRSHHFDKDRYDYHDYNETHNGVYLNVNRWSTGTFINSADERSVFVTYNPNVYRKESFAVNMVAGIANGYEGWENSQGDYLLIVGVSAQWKILKTIVSPDAVAFGFEVPLN